MKPVESTIITGFLRVVRSGKVQFAVSSLTGAWLAIRDASAGMDATHKTVLWSVFEGAVFLTVREVISAWTQEDVAASNAQVTPAPPATQVNVGGGNVQDNQTPDAQPPVAVVVAPKPTAPAPATGGFMTPLGTTYHMPTKAKP